MVSHAVAGPIGASSLYGDALKWLADNYSAIGLYVALYRQGGAAC